MLFKAHFKKRDYWTVMCPECQCSIDTYKDPENCKFVKCSSCGQIYNLENPAKTILKIDNNNN